MMTALKATKRSNKYCKDLKNMLRKAENGNSKTIQDSKSYLKAYIITTT